jgi:hypothetical protein
LVFGLLLFVFLQRDLNDWIAFMQNDAAMALFGLYVVVGLLGVGFTVLLKKSPNILSASPKILAASFLVAIVVSATVFTYLNFTATQANYQWLNDGYIYQEMGQSWLQNHEFILNGNFSHHFGPIYPLYLSVFFLFLPPQLGSQIAAALMFAAAAVIVFFITKKMYGTNPALITTALVMTLPIYVFCTSRGLSEPLMLILYTLTVYFIMESLKPGKENRIIIAGLLAAIGFLTKSSFGYFFIVTGVGGFLWRFYYMRWSVFKNKNYLIAVGIFLSLLLVWTARDLYHFWDGTLASFLVAVQPSEYMYSATAYTFANDFGGYFVECIFFTALTAVFAATYLWIFADYLKPVRKRFREERISCLLVSIVLPVVIGILITSLYFVYENYFMEDYLLTYLPVSQVRYLIYQLIRYYYIALVPLTWIAYEMAKKKTNPP